MSVLQLDRLILFSQKLRQAKEIRFDPLITVIIGRNQVGKSRILKAIYYTLGAEVEQGTAWESLEPKSILYVRIGGHPYTFYRDSESIAVFDGKTNRRLIKTSHFTSELGPFIARLFKFNLTLANRDGSRVIPPPAFLFLPYYLDQGRSWNDLWNGFTRLSQFSAWQSDLIEYHLGIRGADYYSTKAKVDELHRQLEDCEASLRIAKAVLERAEANQAKLSPPIDIARHRAEIDSMLKEMNNLGTKANKIKEKLVLMNASAFEIEHQRNIVRASLKELKADSASMLQLSDHITCPTCGQIHEQDFTDRFKIARDEERCVELLVELDDEYASLSKRIFEAQSDHSALLLESGRIRQLMEEKKGEISFFDLVEQEGQRKLRQLAQDQVDSGLREVDSLRDQREKVKDGLKSLANPARTKSIKSHLRDRIKLHSIEAGVRPPPESTYDRAIIKLDEDGSARPRAILCAFYGYIETMHLYGDGRALPIVIDSPLQQEQDPINTLGVLKFISSHHIPNHQVVLGTVSNYAIPFQGTIIELPDAKYSLLRSEDYKQLWPEIQRVVVASLDAIDE